MIGIIGDVHGLWPMLYNRIRCQPADQTIIQLGDMGVGFPDTRHRTVKLPANVWWFRGNHDSPEESRAHPQYLGDWGHRVIDGRTVFWVAGAWSIDQHLRREAVSWWRDEELSIAELTAALEEYERVKPDIVISHDGPTQATRRLMNRYSINRYLSGMQNVEEEPIATRTGQALAEMFRVYQPKVWVFGHWHVDWSETIEGTEFHCVGELGFREV